MAEVRQDTKPAASQAPAPQFGATCARLGVDDPDPENTRRVTLAAAGQAQDSQRSGLLQRMGLRVPDPQFPTKIPAGRRSSRPVPAPGGQPDPNPQTGNSSVGPPRWARCPEQGRLHLLRSADVIAATNQGHARAVCGRPIPAEGLTITGGPSGALCMACALGATSSMPACGPRGGNP
ncbi:MAG: hypothetical protein ACRDTA_13825 [Pseudonocardiaceae bacterium]